MKIGEKEKINSIIENEGFDYTFSDYSSFPDIKDENFHKLRKNYLMAREELGLYLGLVL